MGTFYNVDGWGIGKKVKSAAGSITLEFFISPAASERPNETFRNGQVQIISQLDPQTRVFYIDRTSGVWTFGRLMWQAEEECFVSLANGVTDQVNIADLFVRCNRGVPDPCELLATRLTETPYFHSARAMLVQQLVKQRTVAAGLTGLLSSPIELEKHQVEVVRRVLSDPVQRYLLADEVGLGKTIEAGVILRQYVLDCPDNHCALVLVPPALVKQWEHELQFRLQIGEIYGHKIAVVSTDDLKNLPEGFESPGLIIIDEAHQIASGWNYSKEESFRKNFDRVCALTKPESCPRLLLLSATPVRRNEDSFLAMLHLLDPLVYRLDERETFRIKVAARQELADLFYAFTEEQQNLFLEEMANQLAVLFPNDTRLLNLLTLLRPHLDFAVAFDNSQRIDGIRAVRSHLHETYRLHRRVLRNRRSEELDGLLPGRDGLTLFTALDDVVSGQIADALENWRTGAAAAVWGKERTQLEANLGQIYALLLEAAFCDPCALFWCVQQRLRSGQRGADRFGPLLSFEGTELLENVPIFESEKGLLREILNLTTRSFASEEFQFAAVQKEIARRSAINTRTALFTTSPDRADRAYCFLKNYFRGRIFRHSVKEENWRAFLNIPNGVIVCDYRAEEGLNLQGGRTILLHLDFPLSPNRMEQRMGRLDRFGVGNPVESIGFMPQGCAPLDAWVNCLDNAWRVFNRSIASLQFIVDDTMKELRGRLLTDGEQAVRDEVFRLTGEQGIIAKELKSLRAQDELDAVDIICEAEADVTAQILDWEDQNNHFQNILEGWLVQRLQFIRVGENTMGDAVVRYHWCSTNDRHQTLVSRNDFALWFTPMVEIGARHERFRSPLTWPVAFQRQTARHRKVGLARLGNPLVDCLQKYLNWDDRGMAFAFWRQVPFLNEGQTEVFFRFDFSVEVDIGVLEEAISSNSGIAMAALRRISDAAFPPIVATLWLDENLSVPQDQLRKDTLAKPYHKSPDVNLNQARWPLVERYYSLSSWPDLCRGARDIAQKMLLQETDLAQLSENHAVKVETKFARVKEQMLSRIEALRSSKNEKSEGKKELQFQETVHSALAIAIRNPKINLNSAGVVFLARMPLLE
jgi:ATP-dependent helicase HepA